jgi:hypothetical protein
MLEYLIVFAAGLIVGWNVLPQPTWVAALYAKLAEKMKG